MSELTIQRAAPSRALAILALLGLGGWAALTVVIGAGDLVNGVRNVSAFTSAATFSDSEGVPVDAAIALSASLFILWILSLNAVAVAAVIGVVEIAVARRSWRRCVAFAAVAVGGPVAALVVSQIANGDDDVYASTSYLQAVVPGLALIVIALATVVAAWRLLFGPTSDRAIGG